MLIGRFHGCKTMRIDVITLFAQMIADWFKQGVTARGLQQDYFSLHYWNPRDYSDDKNGRVDDRPFGGGPGMLMRYQPLHDTLQAIKETVDKAKRGPLIYLTPQGEPLKQTWLERLSRYSQITLLCGRYEGIDQRFIDAHVDVELSIGDYVLSGGELAAAVLIDAIARLLPGVLNEARSSEEDSFSDGLLECPHYTRPENIANMRAPEILLSGDHQAIQRWRYSQSLGKTFLRRPDLIHQLELNAEQIKLLREFLSQEPNLENSREHHH